MPTYVQGGVTIRSETELSPEEIQQAIEQYRGGADSAGTSRTTTRMEPASDNPLAGAWNPIEDVATFGFGTTTGAGLMKALSQVGRRARFGSGVGSEVARAVERTAPAALKPGAGTIDALSDVMRSGAGRTGLRQAREEGIGGIYRELADAGGTQASAGQADSFKQLVSELASANRAAYNPATAEARTGIGSLAPQRERADILKDIQGMLSPEQWQRFQALQEEYAKGSGLLRLFRAKETGKDVLEDRGALQRRAKTMQGQLDPEVLKAILPGGPVQTDRAINIPSFGLIPPVQWRAAGPSFIEDLLTALGGASGAGLSQFLRPRE